MFELRAALPAMYSCCLRMAAIAICFYWYSGSVSLAWAQQPSASQTPATAAPASETLMRAILEELRHQRILLQRTYINAYRAQVITERLARQQARVDNLELEIKEIQAAIKQAEDTARGEVELQELEIQIRDCRDAQERIKLVQVYESLKRAFEREQAALKKEAADAQVRQAQLENKLQMEQSLLNELQNQLDRLDQELEKLVAEKASR